MEFRCGPSWDERIVNLNPADKVGVLVSGGMDSTILVGLLLKYFPDVDVKLYSIKSSLDSTKNHKLNLDPIFDALNVICEHDISSWEDWGKGEAWSWDAIYHCVRISKTLREIRDDTDRDEVYQGHIMPVNPYFFPKFDYKDQPGYSQRPWRTNDDFLKCPFERLQKYHVIDLARQTGLAPLLKLTNSCNIDNNIKCGVCMGCMEEEFGYYQLDQDKGMTLEEIHYFYGMTMGKIGV